MVWSHHLLCLFSVQSYLGLQAVSLVFATEEYRGLLQPAAEKCGARFCILPNVSSIEDGLAEKEDGTVVPFDRKLAEVEKLSSTLQGKPCTLMYHRGLG